MDILKSYFNDLLDDAIKSEGIELNVASIEYITRMLVDFSQCESLGTADEGMPVLAWCYRDAVNSQGHLRFNSFRRLGDTALFLLGFFSRYVDATGGLNYYVDMGCNAYGQASTAVGIHPVMDELSCKFVPIVSILNYASVQTSIGKEQSIANLFGLHELHTNPSSWRKLMARGAMPVLGTAKG